MVKGDNYMKTYKKKLKLKESVKMVLLVIWLISIVTVGLIYQSYRVDQLEKNNYEEKSRVVEINFTR